MNELLNDLRSALAKNDSQLRLLCALAEELDDNGPQFARVSLEIAKRVGKREILRYVIGQLTARIPPAFTLN